MSLARFNAKFKVSPDGCWLWTAALERDGYGLFRDETQFKAHRWSYEHFIGPIPNGLTIDHLCRVRHCVNPKHLEPVTSRENTLRGNGITAVNAKKTHCPQGHPLSGDNLYTSPGRRHCRACRRAADLRYQERKKNGQ